MNKPEIKTIPGGKEVIEEEKKKLGGWSNGEKVVFTVFVLTALAWIFSKPKNIGGIEIPGISTWLPFVTDHVIAMLAAIILFLIPIDFKKGIFALAWDDAKNIPWGILLLFGGGIALSSAFTKSGLASWLGEQLLFLEGLSPIIVLFAIVTLVIFLTELTSNTAIATLMMPIMASFAIAMGEDSRAFMITAAIAASGAFMLPVATPPNAIMFGTGYVTISQMVRNGIALNLICMILITVMCYFLIPIVFGVSWGVTPSWVK
ncbi:SLC13 family permease [Peptococcaceae bacterium]|nr:SLC13 family permease [Peptococcaceae bacterium]